MFENKVVYLQRINKNIKVMKASLLIKNLEMFLEKVEDDIEVDLNDTHGTYEKITGVRLAMWTDAEGKLHKSIELMHDGSYDQIDTKSRR